ncbi:TYR1-like protein [Mya arenaria]|uniref:TYR1-like protein n=1 Tax=Mya arenaria TaxID=6604 RepID=A0ABY7EW96_MYAAR|nr:TYR1-like protein [Mya arenaria]
MQPAVLCLIPLTAMIHLATGLVENADVPLHLAQCFGYFKRKTTLARTPAGAIQHYCDNNYMWMKAMKRMGRKKRQAGGPPTKPKVRKEIRMMTDKERDLFFEAVNSAKKNTTISPNKYDAMAEMHTGITAISAHGGCAFHPWHRLYIQIFENALREEGPQFSEVTVPYWASDLDNYMTDPTESALFSERLMGTGQGEAKGGIMLDGWDSTTGVITRNLGTDGPLLNDMMIYNITKHHRMIDICGEDSDIDHDLEFHHNGIHRWIDGQMAVLASSVFDPIFWLHHAYIDKIWEDFRENQKRHGIDAETDYPPNPTTMGSHELQLPEAKVGFENLTVLDGLSNIFTEEFFTYAPTPTCNNPKLGCGSKYLKCVKNEDTSVNKDPFRCVGRTLREVEEWEAEQAKPTSEPCVLGEANFTKPIYIPPKETKPVQNTFCMNSNSDTAQWVYLPIKLIIRRPPDFKSYGSYPVQRGRINKLGGDIYSPSAYSNVNRYLSKRPEDPKAYDQCLESDSMTSTIYIKSVGLNYEGVYKEYAIMDKRLAITVATAYVAVRRPLSPTDASVSILHAQDSCGRVCKPICKVPGSDVFRPCSGAVKVSGGHPLQFGNSFGDAVLQVFDFAKEKDCPQVSTEVVIMSFYCDYSTAWIWPSVDAPREKITPPAPVVKPGCRISPQCTVDRPCNNIDANCVDNSFLDCVDSCHVFAKCVRGSYMLFQCRRGERYLSGVGCVNSRANPCDYKKNKGPRNSRMRRTARAMRYHKLPFLE